MKFYFTFAWLLMCVILFAQSEDPPTEKVYRSFYNQTITLTCYSPDKAIKKRYCLFIDTTKTSIFYQKLIERIEFDDYQLSLIERVCRDFKKAKKIKSLWSFKDDERLKNLKEKWIQVQRLNNQTYLFYANDYKNTSFFHLTDSTVVISKKGFPETFFIKNIQNLPYSTLIECFNGIKFTFRILDAKTNLSVLKTECYKPDYKVSYELVIPNKSFKNYNMIVNHSAAGKIPDDILFDEIDFDYISAYIGSITER